MTTNYTRGTSANIIVGAAALFLHKGNASAFDTDLPDYTSGEKYTESLATDSTHWLNVGYTSNGLELDFAPDFGEVKVDQVLDVARMYKQGMKVNLKTTFAEATLENLLIAIASNNTVGTTDNSASTGVKVVDLTAGELGDYPVERGIVAVGPSLAGVERIYKAYRALSIEQVTVSAKREEATMFAVSFRLLPDDNGAYGKIVDRTITPAS